MDNSQMDIVGDRLLKACRRMGDSWCILWGMSILGMEICRPGRWLRIDTLQVCIRLDIRPCIACTLCKQNPKYFFRRIPCLKMHLAKIQICIQYKMQLKPHKFHKDIHIPSIFLAILSALFQMGTFLSINFDTDINQRYKKCIQSKKCKKYTINYTLNMYYWLKQSRLLEFEHLNTRQWDNHRLSRSNFHY